MGLQETPVLRPSASPCRARGGGAAGDSTERLRASQLQPPSWVGDRDTVEMGAPRELQVSRHRGEMFSLLLFICPHVAGCHWWVLPSPVTSHPRAFAKLLQKDWCSVQRGLKKEGGRGRQTYGQGGEEENIWR